MRRETITRRLLCVDKGQGWVQLVEVVVPKTSISVFYHGQIPLVWSLFVQIEDCFRVKIIPQCWFPNWVWRRSATIKGTTVKSALVTPIKCPYCVEDAMGRKRSQMALLTKASALLKVSGCKSNLCFSIPVFSSGPPKKLVLCRTCISSSPNFFFLHKWKLLCTREHCVLSHHVTLT